ncbi:MAG: BCD family MFS transporter [Pseudomonadota bacterium]|nr:BCD family MFS transporter [Pseudomonadota bacterium]
MTKNGLSWISIVRLGLVQMALGSVVVLTTSTLNRLMVVEAALPAIIPGLLVGLHYGVQITRPAWGFFSDKGNNRTKWIILGMAVLAIGGFLATTGVVLVQDYLIVGLAVSILSYTLIGLGVGASGTSLLAFLATTTKPERRAAAAATTWLMMIFGIALTAGIAGSFIDPYSHSRLLAVVAVISTGAFVLTCCAVWKIENQSNINLSDNLNQSLGLVEGLKSVMAEPKARFFTLFVAVSMTAYFMQELILEPYAGIAFGFSPGETTTLSSIQNFGVLIGMLVVGITVSFVRFGSLKQWVFYGCLGSAIALLLISLSSIESFNLPFRFLVVALGFFNGAFAVAAIGTMMQFASDGQQNREGTRMGLWGASQALAAGFAGLVGTGMVDIIRFTFGNHTVAFGTVFLIEAVLFIVAAVMSTKLDNQTAKGTFYSALGATKNETL